MCHNTVTYTDITRLLTTCMDSQMLPEWALNKNMHFSPKCYSTLWLVCNAHYVPWLLQDQQEAGKMFIQLEFYLKCFPNKANLACLQTNLDEEMLTYIYLKQISKRNPDRITVQIKLILLNQRILF